MKSPTRITQTSALLLTVQLFANNPDVITEVGVPDLSISHHCSISCSESMKLPKWEPKIKLAKWEPKTHSYRSLRSFKHFNMTTFCTELHRDPVTQVLNCTDPDKALALWYNVYLTALNKHAPLKHKRVKHAKLPPWLNNVNKDSKETIAET